MTAPPCRLFVIPARDADVAAIVRRGPSRWTQVLRWDLERDVVEDGAWFKGRIYAERCDLSPDGTLFLYFCHGGAQRPGYTDAWTAVSRLPWLHALALWPWGTTYGGGGRFLGPRTLALRVGGAPAPHPDHPADGLEIVEADTPVHASTEEVEGADWTGRDRHGRLLACVEGKVYRDGRLVADLNARRPDPAPPPEWARRPLRGG